jgi:hypothetical protein
MSFNNKTLGRSSSMVTSSSILWPYLSAAEVIPAKRINTSCAYGDHFIKLKTISLIVGIIDGVIL